MIGTISILLRTSFFHGFLFSDAHLMLNHLLVLHLFRFLILLFSLLLILSLKHPFAHLITICLFFHFFLIVSDLIFGNLFNQTLFFEETILGSLGFGDWAEGWHVSTSQLAKLLGGQIVFQLEILVEFLQTFLVFLLFTGKERVVLRQVHAGVKLTILRLLLTFEPWVFQVLVAVLLGHLSQIGRPDFILLQKRKVCPIVLLG